MIALAESYGIIVSEHRRKLLTDVEHMTADKLAQLKAGIGYDEEGQLAQSDEQRKTYEKSNADEKKILLNAEIVSLTAELDFVTNLENLIKRRCSIGQSILNSINTEKSSAYNN